MASSEWDKLVLAAKLDGAKPYAFDGRHSGWYYVYHEQDTQYRSIDGLMRIAEETCDLKMVATVLCIKKHAGRGSFFYAGERVVY
jgi:hypothetical protein